MNRRNIGSTLDSLLDEMDVLRETQLLAQKKRVARAIEEQRRRQRVSKAELAKRMGTSRPQVDRLLDPANTSITLDTLAKVAAALGLDLLVQLIPKRQPTRARTAEGPT